ncbi:urease accessory protein UreD [Mycobacterium sp. PSTR-4-N]|uniref:urease accessory protein UreD n=1 Tax=Mycobacterium sp. PSTR-4-N TaxID=2917745 RepID=UPI001F153C3F|nr:urease accessory protein UreD [Mycobacterium sp. PSTR-4-N]MCG7598076.1 urease accessory protein UreD [Mycobacterium sp. PSTR-4-N]
MRSEVLIVARPGRSPHTETTGAIAVRRTGRDTVHLVSAAATPLGGDTIRMRVVVEEGARLALRTVAATMVLPGAATTQSHACWTVEVAGTLDLDPQPTIVAGRARHTVHTALSMTAGASVRVAERVQIGRSGERDGYWCGTLRADLDGAALLRHRVDVGAGSVADDEIAAPRAYESEMRYPAADVATRGMTLALAGGGSLTTWQGDRL